MNDNNYNPNEIESKWYKKWECSGVFDSIPNKQKAFTITMPPPNVTGVLHMGHILNNTIQDAFIRYARMKNYNACWLPGMDHASIATENKVVSALQKKGIEKNDLSRTEFLKYVWDWKEKHGGIILKQLRYLGASCDWKRTKFTMDNDMSESVIDIFIDLYKKGVIYRGVRMVNWDSKAQTALSDEEVIYKETESTLYYIRYLIEGSNQFLEIATSRPETLLGDSAVCVNPNDQRYIHLRNKYVITPIIGRKIPIIFDDYVDSEFGSGVLKITPAHDINDYCIGLKYNLDIINILNNDGTVNELGGKFQGQDRFECRANILKELRELGLLVKEVPYINNIGYSERTNSIIEPKLSTQWFCKMNELAKPAINVVTNNQIKFYPDKYKNIYLHWMNNIKDWCISRQLWWGQRIPAYYIDNGEYVVAKDIEEAYIIFKQKYPDLSITDLKQDEDVLDTWFSSWLWPISSFGGIHDKNNEELKYYYPINVLVTAPDIIFFWVARMIMFGLYWKNEIPFEKVCFTGLVRDKSKRKMSKSLGNSPDPIDLINKYGADGVRVGMLLCAPAGTDIIFDEQQCLQGRNFVNKLWNAYKLINSWTVDNNLQQPTYSQQAIEWFTNLISYTQLEIEHNIENCRMSDALHNVYELIWDNFCPYYLEIIKLAVVTTADNLTDKVNDTFREYIDVIRLSVSSYDEKIFKKVHCGLNYNKIWDNIKRLGNEHAYKTVIHLTGGSVIYEGLEITVEKLREIGFREFRLFPLWNRAGDNEVKAKEEEFRHDIIEKLGLRSSESEYDGGNSSDYINDYKRNKLTNPKYCIVGDSSLFITYNGDILGCFQDFSGKCIVANIRNSNLKDIIKHKKDKVGRYEFCSNCNSNIAILNID